ncbi:MAG: 23S rRNA (adenine(1618)-N(6))-methyltransferase RlmF [Verrucomicrobia bacterium]|nr:23S rRNA (adenine(1618)-N(6))-methyltransferase RlmF [Verrucomicrobiota bacterium]
MESVIKSGLHPRNRFSQRYDFPELVRVCPSLAVYVKPNAHGDDSLDFADPLAVKALNQALLSHAYGLHHWDIPAGFLCPPIPGRSDYIHYLADLISMKRGTAVRVLDVGAGANAIYPLIGASEYGWCFVGAEVDSLAYEWGRKMIANHPSLAGLIEYRQQRSAKECFQGIIKPDEHYELTMCNPPSHTSAAEAAAGSQRKWRNLGRLKAGLNFGGREGELWCEGGELAFIRRMITQSVPYAQQVHWFTTLVSKSAHLPHLEHALRNQKAAEVKVIEMAQGQKKSRLLAWTFQSLPNQA